MQKQGLSPLAKPPGMSATLECKEQNYCDSETDAGSTFKPLEQHLDQILQDWTGRMDQRFDEWMSQQKVLLQTYMSGMALRGIAQAHTNMQPSFIAGNPLLNGGSRGSTESFYPKGKASSIQGHSKPLSLAAGDQSMITDFTHNAVGNRPSGTAVSHSRSCEQSFDSRGTMQSIIEAQELRRQRPLKEEIAEKRTMQAKIHNWMETRKQALKSGGYEKCARVGRCLNNPFFDRLILLAIFTNVIFIGVQVDFSARFRDTEEHDFFTAAEYIFFVVFSIELLMRLIWNRLKWLLHVVNLFDAALVVLQLTELIIRSLGEEDGASVLGALRVLRTLRILRVVRVLRFFKQLRTMVRMIIHSLESLFWLLVLLGTILYAASIVFTSAVSDYLSTARESETCTECKGLEESFPELPTTILSLFKSITNGLSWGPLVDDLFAVHTSLGIVFLIYIFFVLFSVLNVITGVFVDGAIQSAGSERETLLRKEQKDREDACVHLIELLSSVDQDNTGKLTLDELINCEELSDSFAVLQINISDFANLFDYLDDDGSGEVDTTEFVQGCMKLRGEARSIDLHMLMHKMERQNRKVQKVMADMSQVLSQDITALYYMLPQFINSNPASTQGCKPVQSLKMSL